MSSKQYKRIVVLPADSFNVGASIGTNARTKFRYNPDNMFDDVVVGSVLDKKNTELYGISICAVSFLRYKSFLLKKKPTIFRSFAGHWTSDLGFVACPDDVPHVVSLHDGRSSWCNFSVKYADAVICVSDSVKRMAISQGVLPEKCWVIPNYIDGNVFKPLKLTNQFNEQVSSLPKGRSILHVGRKSKDNEKNIDTVIKSLNYLPKDNHVIFIGAGNSVPFKKIAEDHGVSDRCFWIESVPNEDLSFWYNWCDVMCVPSLFEGFGIVFIEAAACGAAIVTSNIAPMNEYLTHGKSAYLVDNYTNPKEIASAIQMVFKDEIFAQKLKASAVDVGKLFDFRLIQKKEAELYAHVIENFKPRKYSLLKKYMIDQYLWFSSLCPKACKQWVKKKLLM